MQTLNELFFHATRVRTNPKAFQRKINGEYQAVSAAEFEKKAFQIALGLRDLGIEKSDRVGLISPNRLEWALADYGILLNGGVNVPIYPTLIAEQVQYVLENSEAKAVFVADDEQLTKILSIRESLPMLRHIVLMDGVSSTPGVISFEAVLETGGAAYESGKADLEQTALSVRPNDPCSIIYTSGTTGNPKGVVLRHGNIVSNVLSSLQILDIDNRDSALSFLPLSHIFERMAGYYTMLYAGASIAYAESIDTVPQNLLEVRPTVMISVPRLYEKMYARILDAALSGNFIKKNLFFWAKKTGEQWAELDIARQEKPRHLEFGYKVASKLVFSKLQARTGGRLRFFVSGGAPLAPEIAKFFYAAGLIILEGYGLTETSPVITANTFEHYRLGSVGRVLPGVEVKIAPDGEILTRGPNVMEGYYKNPEATRAVIDEANWFATGDIGQLDKDGYLSITDRKKDLLVTAGGKNIAPQPIENAVKSDKFISECILIGDKRPFVSAIIVPNFEYLVKYAKRKSILYTSQTGLVQDPKVLDLFRRRVDRYNQQLSQYEQIKQFRLLDHELRLEDGEITPTLKVRRRRIAEVYADLIDSIYQGGRAQEP